MGGGGIAPKILDQDLTDLVSDDECRRAYGV